MDIKKKRKENDKDEDNSQKNHVACHGAGCVCGSREKWEQPCSSKGAVFVPESKGADDQAAGKVGGEERESSLAKRERVSPVKRERISAVTVFLYRDSLHTCASIVPLCSLGCCLNCEK